MRIQPGTIFGEEGKFSMNATILPTLPVHHTRLNRGLKRLWHPSEKAPPSPYFEVLADNLATADVIENLMQVRLHHQQNPVHFSSLDTSLKPLL
jgi:hypothetical protein